VHGCSTGSSTSSSRSSSRGWRSWIGTEGSTGVTSHCTSLLQRLLGGTTTQQYNRHHCTACTSSIAPERGTGSSKDVDGTGSSLRSSCCLATAMGCLKDLTLISAAEPMGELLALALGHATALERCHIAEPGEIRGTWGLRMSTKCMNL
jgi:hypothetical protein